MDLVVASFEVTADFVNHHVLIGWLGLRVVGLEDPDPVEVRTFAITGRAIEALQRALRRIIAAVAARLAG